jgi:hypothetical protein
LDRMIDAALDRGAEVLWVDAGHRAPMQVSTPTESQNCTAATALSRRLVFDAQET